MFSKLKDILLHSGYRVILTSDFTRQKSGGLARATKGYILPDDLKIFINRGININDRVVTLIHELLHEIKPSWEETKVDHKSKSIFKKLTISELGFLQFFIMSPAEIRAMLSTHKSYLSA